MEGVMTCAQSFFGWLLQTTLVASLVICLILLIQKILGGRLGPRWCHALWLVLLIRMILPWSPSSRLSVSNLIHSLDSEIQSRQQLPPVEQEAVSSAEQTAETFDSIAGPEPESDSAALEPVAPKPPVTVDGGGESKLHLAAIRQVLPVLWLAGAIVIGIYLLVSDLALWRIVKRDSPLVNQPMLELFEECKAQMGVQSLVVVVPSDQVRSPGLFGFVRPRLLLPRQMLDNATTGEIRYVFLHELAHLRRRDIYLGWLTSLLQVLHWFNPLVWLAFYRMRADRELACDALVLTRTGQDKSQEYGGAIVGLVRRFSRSRPLPAMAGVIESKSQLKRRIAMITQFKSNSYRWSPLAVILIIILACVSLPEAKRTKASEETTLEPAPPVTLRQVWSGPDADAYGGPSPDGRYLSHTEWKNGDLSIRELATGKTRRLTETKKGGREKSFRFALNSVISPDGKLIAYSWTNQYGTYDLCLVGTDGSGDRTLYSNKDHELYPGCWSSDGKRVAARKFGGHPEIISVSVADGSVQVLKAFEKSFWPQFCYSPDDRFVVYDFPVAENSGNHDISLIRTDGSGEIPLVKHPANDRLLGWIPNSDQILFRSDRSGTHDIWAVKVVDGKVQGVPSVITREVGEISPQGFSQDGNFYFSRYTRRFTTRTFPFDVRTGEIQIELGRTLLGSNFGPEWSPDGKYLAYVEEQTQPAGPGWYHRPLHIRNVKTGEERILADEFEVRAPRWSPDGRTILFIGAARKKPRQGKYNGGIYKIDVEGRQVTKVLQFPPVEEWSRDIWIRSISEWSRDGKTIFYTSRNRLIRRELKSGKEKQLYERDQLARALDLSPDGKRLVFVVEASEEAGASVLTISVSGGEATELCRFQESKGGIRVPRQLTWTPDSNYVLFVRNEEKGSTVWRVSPGGGDPEVIWTSKDRLTGLSVHPAGDRIAVSSYLQENSIWVMENFLPEEASSVTKPESMTTVRRIGSDDWGTFASLSPDGKYLCDVDWDTENLAVLELTTGKVRHVTRKSPDDACYPLESAISPDSKEVAYLWWDPNTKASSLHVVGLDGSGDRLLCEGKYPTPRAWSVDGKKILAVISENDVQQLVWISASDGSIQHITSFPAEGLGYPGKFDISPDGRFVAYDRLQAENTSQRDIFAFDLIDNREFPVIQHPSNDKLLGWTPDGGYIFFTSYRTGIWDAWCQKVVDDKPRGYPKLIKQGIGDVRPIGFTPHGSYYYAHERELQDVFTARLDLETGAVLSEPMPVRQTGATACHDWSPDGRYLAYCERRPDKSQVIYIRTLATGQERMLADNLPYIRWLRWSLDGRSILIDGTRRRDSQSIIFKIDVQTGGRTDLVRSETEGLIRPEMSPDGKTLYFDRNDPKSRTMRLMARDLESGREKELFRTEPPARISGSALSPDGRQFVLSIIPSRAGPGGPVLKTLSTAGGQPKELIQFNISEKLRAVGVTWMPDSRNVIFWKWHQGFKDLELWRISAEGGEPQRLWLRKALGQMRVHPDGQHVAFYDRSTTRGVWVVENFLPEQMGK